MAQIQGKKCAFRLRLPSVNALNLIQHPKDQIHKTYFFHKFSQT